MDRLTANDKHAIALMAVKQANAGLFRATIDKRVAEKCAEDAKMKNALERMDAAEREVKYYEEILTEYPESATETATETATEE